MWKCIETSNLDKIIEKYETVEMNMLTERLREGSIEKCWKSFYDWVDNVRI